MKLGTLMHVTSQEDDKKVIKSEGQCACFDVTMLTNMAI